MFRDCGDEIADIISSRASRVCILYEIIFHIGFLLVRWSAL